MFRAVGQGSGGCSCVRVLLVSCMFRDLGSAMAGAPKKWMSVGTQVEISVSAVGQQNPADVQALENLASTLRVPAVVVGMPPTNPPPNDH